MDLKEIKAIPIDRVAEHLGAKNNGSLKIQCYNTAAHKNGDKKPSLGLDLVKNRYKCFTCGESGSNIDLVKGYKNITVGQAITELKKINGIKTDTKMIKTTEPVKTYTFEDIQKWKLGNKVYTDCFDYSGYIKTRFRNPSNRSDKDDLYFTRTENGKFIKGRKCSPELYNKAEIVKRHTDIICYVEGEPCVNTLRLLGYLSTTAGSATISEVTFTQDMISNLKDRDIMIFPDNDDPGKKLIDSLYSLINQSANSVKVVDIPTIWKQLFHEEMPPKEDIKNFAEKYKAVHGDKGLENVIDDMIKDAELITNGLEEVDSWGTIIHFNDYSQLPEFPTHVLPPIGRKMAEAVADVTQVDMGLAGTIYLSMLSTCLHKKAFVDLETHIEPLSIYTCPTIDSGERKSGTLKRMAKPIFDYQKEKKKEMVESINESVNQNKIRQSRLELLQKNAAKAKNEIERAKFEREASIIANEITDNPVITEPLFIMDNTTPEALADNMADNGERMAMISAEGGIFEIMAGRYNAKGSDLDIFLKSHTGDEPWSNHRIGRLAKHMDSPSLALCLIVQHETIKTIGKNDKFRGVGLLARFLYVFCESKIGYRPRQRKTIPDSVLMDYKMQIYSLMDIPLNNHMLTLSPDATIVWDTFYNDIETDMKPGNQMSGIKDWGSKLSGAVARIAGLLHYAEHGKEAANLPISVGIVGASCAIGAYYREHALAVFGLMQDNQQVRAAEKILEYLKLHKPNTFKGRDVLQNKHAFKSMTDITPGLEMLVERNYVRKIEKTFTGIGRPEAATYEINPKTKNV